MFWRGEIALSWVTVALVLLTARVPFPKVVVAAWVIVEFVGPSSEIVALPFHAVPPVAAKFPRTRIVPLFKLEEGDVELRSRLPFTLRLPLILNETRSWLFIELMVTLLNVTLGALNV